MITLVINTVQYLVDNFYTTSLPGYTLKPVDLDFNTCPQKKRSFCKGIGKTPKRSVINHLKCKLKKRHTHLKLKIHSYENSKSF
ncbi:MAG: hypothetical protein JNJ40_06955 [Bacteroidia bacterium]|nr:hypothetical protein [Bacteroidia bacterium]